MYILLLYGSYNVKAIEFEKYTEALEAFNYHKKAGRTCYLTKVLMSTV